MEKYVCIHGHFYQPPRENPWLEAVELQDSAAPWHDWNERITAECYAPNARARILDGDNRIIEILNNYSKVSFNFGPTLLAWMKDKAPDIHDAIVEADYRGRERFSGHGPALAQVYNHMILPLANDRDRKTQVYWGIKDFEWRFGRKPEGMWLSETAADTPTLETLAEQGILFTILSPYQASRFREIGKRTWRDANGGRIDPTRPYLMKLPSGHTITLFFYDAPVSQAVAFEKLLVSGEKFAGRLMSAFNDRRQWDQLVHIATDGESYGHHHRHGEMALAYALNHIESQGLAKLTVYGEYLEKHAPNREVQIHEKSAWSCSHGVGRWMNDCGCCAGGHEGWNQKWRTPLRDSLDWLRDQLGLLYERHAGELLRDPWGARDAYIEIILDRSPESRERFFQAQAARTLSEAEKVTALKLLELQRHAMLMYTSCGWFFDELSGIESVQVVQYAARSLQLAGELFNQDLEPGFLERFENARSNIPENANGRTIYGKFVKPAMIDLPKVAGHYALSSIFHQYPEKLRMFSFTFDDEDRKFLTAGKSRLVVGKGRVISEITEESVELEYAMLYMGEHNATGGVRPKGADDAYETMNLDIKGAFDAGDFPEVIRAIDRHFGGTPYSLRTLFKDEQRRILQSILQTTREDIEVRFRLIMERYGSLMKFLGSINAPLPQPLQTVSGFSLHAELRRNIESETLDLPRIRTLVREASEYGPQVLDADISYAAKCRLEKLAEQMMADPHAPGPMQALAGLAEIMVPLPIGLNLWKVQNIYWEMSRLVLPEMHARSRGGDAAATEWVERFVGLGERLYFNTKVIQGRAEHENQRHAA